MGLSFQKENLSPKTKYRYTKRDGMRIAIHRVVLEKKLGRPLLAEEHTHHINEIKLDNSPENLEVKTASKHAADHLKKRWESGEKLGRTRKH
jgi:hypothetical protein